MSQLRWGLVDLDGNTVLPMHYDFVDEVSDNGIVSVRGDGMERYIHLDGTSAVPGEFERAFSFKAGLAVVQQRGLYGVINEAGEWIITNKYEGGLNFSSDLAAARLNGKYGYINRKGEVVVPLVYEHAEIPSEGCGWLKDSNRMWGCVGTLGTLRIPFKYQEAVRFGESLAFVIGNDFKGFINLEIKIEYLSKNGSPDKNCPWVVIG